MRMLRLPSPSYCLFSFPQDNSPYVLPFLRMYQSGNIPLIHQDYSGTGQSLLTSFHMEAGGSPVSPYFPFLPLIWSKTPVESPQLSPISKRWFDMAPTTSTVKASDNKYHFGAQYIPSVVTVYASCQHLCSLRKTRFRWLTTPCRTGLVTCREVLRCFILLFNR
jgi:hypothetical protein